MAGSSHAAASTAPYTGAEPDHGVHRTVLPDATLIVLAPSRQDGDGIEGDRAILGLSPLRRAVLAAERAGICDIRIVTDRADRARAQLDGTSAVIEKADAGLPAGRVVIMSANVIATTRWFEALRALPHRTGVLRRDGGIAAVLDLAGHASENSAAQAMRSNDPFDALADSFETAAQSLDPAGRYAVAAGDTAAAENWLLKSLVKDTEGFMSRHVERPISLAISRRLVDTGITPNAMTLISAAIGLASAPFFLSAAPVYQVIGAILLLTHSILDGCDGELARLKFIESRWGGILDFWGDNIVHVAVFACMAVGATLATGAAWPIVAGIAAVLGAGLSAAVVYWHTMREKDEKEPLFTSVANVRESLLSKLLDALTRRDFIYLVLALSIFGKAAWFLVLAAIGAPIFLIMLLFIARTDKA